MVTDEFTFPIITSNNGVNPTVLPPLWRISSINNKNPSESELDLQENGTKRKIFRKSFSEIEAQINRAQDREFDDVKAKAEEEKMDMLWEDFNDDLHLQGVNICSSSSYDSTATSSVGSGCESDHSKCNNGEYYVDEFENRGECDIVHDLIPRKKKKNLEMVMKMLKKLSLLQNMARIKKRGLN